MKLLFLFLKEAMNESVICSAAILFFQRDSDVARVQSVCLKKLCSRGGQIWWD